MVSSLSKIYRTAIDWWAEKWGGSRQLPKTIHIQDILSVLQDQGTRWSMLKKGLQHIHAVR